MFKYIRQRIAFAILALFVISIFSFCLVAAFAPNPIRPYAEDIKNASGHGGGAQETLETIIKRLEVENGMRYGTEDAPGAPIPIIARYFAYIGKVFKGDFGLNINPKNNPNPAVYTTMAKLFFIPLKYSLMVSLPAFILSSISGITIGVFAGYKRGKLFDTFANIFTLLFIALPSFIIAPIAILAAAKSGVSPVVDFNQSTGVIINSLIPPIIVMTLGSMASYAIYSRNQVITVLTSNYILIAKTKGLNGRQIFFKYVLRNISIPIFSILSYSFITLLSGSIIVERYWNIPGTSQVIAYSFPSGEINIVMFSILFFTFLSLTVEIFIDVMFAVLDPKIKYGATSKKNYWLFFKAYLLRKKMIKDLMKQKQENESISAEGSAK